MGRWLDDWQVLLRLLAELAWRRAWLGPAAPLLRGNFKQRGLEAATAMWWAVFGYGLGA